MTQYFTSIQQFTAIFLYDLIAYRCAIKILLKNVFFQEVKNNIAHALQKKKNVGEMVAFALNEMANLADVRRRKSGIVRNAKAYKIPRTFKTIYINFYQLFISCLVLEIKYFHLK